MVWQDQYTLSVKHYCSPSIKDQKEQFSQLRFFFYAYLVIQHFLAEMAIYKTERWYFIRLWDDFFSNWVTTYYQTCLAEEIFESRKKKKNKWELNPGIFVELPTTLPTELSVIVENAGKLTIKVAKLDHISASFMSSCSLILCIIKSWANSGHCNDLSMHSTWLILCCISYSKEFTRV